MGRDFNLAPWGGAGMGLVSLDPTYSALPRIDKS